MSTLKDVNLENANLLEKGFSVDDLKGKTITIVDFEEKSGNMGEYLSIMLENEPYKKFVTGSQNIVEKLKAAKDQDLLPITVKVVKHGNAGDIE